MQTRSQRPIRDPSLADALIPLITLAVLIATLLAFVVWQYLMPPDFDSTFVLNHRGVAAFRDRYGITASPLALHSYQVGFRVLVVTSQGIFVDPMRTLQRVRRQLILRGWGDVPVLSETWKQYFAG